MNICAFNLRTHLEATGLCKFLMPKLGFILLLWNVFTRRIVILCESSRASTDCEMSLTKRWFGFIDHLPILNCSLSVVEVRKTLACHSLVTLSLKAVLVIVCSLLLRIHRCIHASSQHAVDLIHLHRNAPLTLLHDVLYQQHVARDVRCIIDLIVVSPFSQLSILKLRLIDLRDSVTRDLELRQDSVFVVSAQVVIFFGSVLTDLLFFFTCTSILFFFGLQSACALRIGVEAHNLGVRVLFEICVLVHVFKLKFVFRAAVRTRSLEIVLL
jgi:hypothetical protein